MLWLRPGRGQRDAQNGVGTQPRLVGCAVEFYHAAVYGYLVKETFPFECVGNLSVDVGDSLFYTFSTVATFVAVAQFRGPSLLPDRCPGGTDARPITPFSPYTSTSTGGVAAGVENFPASDFLYLHSDCCFCYITDEAEVCLLFRLCLYRLSVVRSRE